MPFTNKLKFPDRDNGMTDFSMLSMDCFHFSQKGYALASHALWNNMLEPNGNKSENWIESFENFKCPTEERPFLTTRFN